MTLPMTWNEWAHCDGVGLADLVRKGQVTPRELAMQAAAAIEKVNPQITGVIEVFADAIADPAGNGTNLDGPFAGLPFLMKDLGPTMKGRLQEQGSLFMAGNRPTADTFLTTQMRKAGLNLIGRTTTPEFGVCSSADNPAVYVTRNPWNTDYSTCGSSAGSGAMVAAGAVPIAHSTDGGGSIRIPAAACGLFGIKAGRGRISMGPMFGEGMNGAAVQGVVSRSVRDSAAMLDILQGPEPHAPYFMPAPATPYLDALKAPVRKLRIGFSWASPLGTEVHPEARAAVERAATLLRSLGHEVDEASPAIDGVQMAQDFLLSWFAIQAGLVDDIMAHTGARPSDFEPDTRAMAAVGRSVGASELLRSQARWHEHVRALSRFHARYDCWMSPVLSAPPVRIGALDTPKALHLLNELISGLRLSGWLRSTPAFQKAVIQNLAWTPYTQLGNLTGRPAMSVPLHWTPEGLPMGVQFVGALDSEALLLQLATQLEQAQPWFDRRPPL